MILPYDWKEKIKPGNLRQTINENSMVMSIGAVVIVVLAIAWCVHVMFPGQASVGNRDAYFIDTTNGAVSVKPAGTLVPLKGSTGHLTVVQVIYYSCNDCHTKTAAYYMRYSKKALQAMQQMRSGASGKNAMPLMVEVQYSGQEVSLPSKNPQWVPASSPQGGQIMAARGCPAGHFFKLCLPS